MPKQELIVLLISDIIIVCIHIGVCVILLSIFPS